MGPLIRRLAGNGTELTDGDRVLGGDPRIGTLHQNDVQMSAPLLLDGGRPGRAGVKAPGTDTGRTDFASWPPKATERRREGLRCPRRRAGRRS